MIVLLIIAVVFMVGATAIGTLGYSRDNLDEKQDEGF